MKKILLSISIILSLMVFNALLVSAHNYTGKVGVSFSLSDDWELLADNYDFMSFEHKYGNNEGIRIASLDLGIADLDDHDINEWKETFNKIFSNENLASEMVDEKTGTEVAAQITSDGVPLISYEYHNNLKYVRYEKAYTARGAGYISTAFYTTCYATVKGGTLYMFSYDRKTSTNHFTDFTSMLYSMSYDNLIKITVNGKMIYPDSDPFIIYERTLVPIRAIAEAMGYTVAWDGENQIVSLTAYDGSVQIFFRINDYSAIKAYNNIINEISLDVPPLIVSGRTYLPVRAVAEAMNADVGWDGNSKTVVINDRF